MASQKLEFLRKMDPARAIEVVAKLRGIGGAAKPATAAAAPAPADPQAPKIFAALDKRLAENPGLAKEVRAAIEFVVDGHRKSIALDAKDPTKVDATIAVGDADFAQLASGKATAKSLYQHGKLRVDGDVSVAHRLGFLKGLI
jgi:3-hydroxyacyl-CoA dehydrogenase/3a,7a,12a-trihydroxy-5b-cholest-24-enoyl-CoA hydratase